MKIRVRGSSIAALGYTVEFDDIIIDAAAQSTGGGGTGGDTGGTGGDTGGTGGDTGGTGGDTGGTGGDTGGTGGDTGGTGGDTGGTGGDTGGTGVSTTGSTIHGNARPSLWMLHKSKKTHRATMTLRGKASDDTSVSRVQYRVRSKKTGKRVYRLATGNNRWTLHLHLKPGKNIVYVRAVDNNGVPSKWKRIKITRLAD